MRQGTVLAGAFGLALLAFLGWGRPAPVRSARVQRFNATTPTFAELALEWGSGARPQRVIVDVESGAARGSATVSGTQVFVSVPLHGRPADTYRISTTAYYRTLGKLHTATTIFANRMPAGGQ